MGVTDAPWMLGVRAPDRGRAILVVTVDGELAVAVRDAVPGGMAVVRDARSDDADDIAAACLPWPWMVVGSAVALTPALASVLRNRPVLTLLARRSSRRPPRPRALLRPARSPARRDPARMHRAASAGCASPRAAASSSSDGTLVRGATLESLIARLPGRIRTSRAQLPSGLGRAGTAQRRVGCAA